MKQKAWPRQLNRQLAVAAGVALVQLLVLAAGASAQSAPQIIHRHVKALGGAKTLKRVTSVRLSGTAGGSGAFVWQTQAPAAYYLEVRDGESYTLEAFNGKSAWRADPAAGVRTLTGKDQQRARATGTHRNGHFLTYEKDKTRARLLGRVTVEGRAAYAVEMTTVAGIRRKVFFDAQTYLVAKEEQECESGIEEIFFSDYRAVNGIQEPYRIRIRRGTDTLELAVREVVHNVQPDAGLFDFPRRPGAPLPDIPDLIRQVLDNQNELQRAREDYTYTKTETDTKVGGQGEVHTVERTYEVFSVHGKRVQKLVAKNGQRLSRDEARKEDERIAKLIREHEKAAVKRADQERKRAGKQADDDDGLTVGQILRVCQFVNPRRERFRGREAVVLDFEARPGRKSGSRIESAIRKLVGSVWIDENAERLLRLEARVSEPIKIGGGLVLSLQRGSSMVFEQDLVNGEVWLPTYAEVVGSARVLLVKGFNINQAQRFSDYKKFDVETSSELKAVVQ